MMYKNIAIVFLLIISISEGVFLFKNKFSSEESREVLAAKNVTSPRPAPPVLSTGMKLSDSPLSQFAYKIVPENLDSNAQNALIGWNIKNSTQKDNSILYTLTPKDSDDQSQTYLVKPGNNLYFIEITKADDNQLNNSDKNLRDDYGIIVDANGIVQ